MIVQSRIVRGVLSIAYLTTFRFALRIGQVSTAGHGYS